MHKMCQNSKEIYKKFDIEIIGEGRSFWIKRFENRISLQKLGTNFWQMWSKKNKNNRYELMPDTKFERSRIFVRNDLAQRKKVVD